MDLETVLPVVWFGVIGFGVLMYVLLDGFVLGLGILLPFAEDEAQRDIMMTTAAPIWDGNETWLVLGGAGLFAAFPKAYAIVLSALYLPVLLMLIALIFRGVAFEFRFKAGSHRHIWTYAFVVGSAFTAFAQGVILGALVEGMPLEQGRYIGGAFDWFSPFSMLTGVAVMFGYALLGATWLIMKTEARVQRIAYDVAPVLLVAVLAFMARWFEGGRFLWLSPIPVLVLVAAIAQWIALRKRAETSPFWLAQSLFLLGFIGLVVGIWPNIVPPTLSIWDAAAPPSSQGFVLAGLAVLLPAVLGYTWWSYSVFRGKVTAPLHY